MTLALAVVAALAHRCAPTVAPETLVSLVHAESRFDPFAIGVNAAGVARPRPVDKASAVAIARALIAAGYNIDIGLGQINSSNLRRLGLSVEDAFDPCRNLASSARVLSENYVRVASARISADAAIATAMSLYNTGNRWRGFNNGYVGRVYESSGLIIPALRAGASLELAGAPARPHEPAVLAARNITIPARTARWETSAGAQAATLMVFGGSLSSTKGTSE